MHNLQTVKLITSEHPDNFSARAAPIRRIHAQKAQKTIKVAGIDLCPLGTPDMPPKRPKTSHIDLFTPPAGAKIDTCDFFRPRAAFGPLRRPLAVASTEIR